MVSAMVVRSNLAFRLGTWSDECIEFIVIGVLLRSKFPIFCGSLVTYLLILGLCIV